ncbi:MAG: PilZ domain-containing protein [Desulfobacteraceae bacterium]|jgi:c-di-GMP-binding flagellar brake protein YcgR
MDDAEKITGKKILKILEQLKNNHTMMSIHVMGTGFDGLSIILGISDGENPRFFIDYPGRSDAASPFVKGKKCYFEFTDENRIPYRFKTTIDSIFGRRIKFNFPGFIERSQRRKAFRIPTPSGTQLLYRNKDIKFEFDIINISETGLLASIKNESHSRGLLYKGNIFKKVSLVYKQEDFSVFISIQSAEIVRTEKAIQNDGINIGLKFTDLNKKDRDELRRFVYYCQRRLLQKRGGLEN